MTRRIKFRKLFLCLLVVIFVIIILLKVLSLKVTNIYVSGNIYYSDQEIIEFAKLSNYPSCFLTFSNRVESSIKGDSMIESVNVNKKGCKIYINVLENRPLLYDQVSGKTILKDGSSIDKKINVPFLSNSVSADVYNEFLSQLSNIDYSVYDNISEIEYTPNSVDNKLFLFTMNDGNYIYADINKFDSINKYFDMIVNFKNHKGILYLDSGEYFKILDN